MIRAACSSALSVFYNSLAAPRFQRHGELHIQLHSGTLAFIAAPFRMRNGEAKERSGLGLNELLAYRASRSVDRGTGHPRASCWSRATLPEREAPLNLHAQDNGDDDGTLLTEYRFGTTYTPTITGITIGRP